MNKLLMINQSICQFFVIILLGAFASCSGKSNEAASGIRGAVPNELQPLYEEILAVHDEVMPELNTITSLQEQMKNKLDELRGTPANTEALKEANRILGDLNKAENAMWSWMHNFSKLDSIPDGEKSAFLEVEKMSVNSMKELMLSSIEQAKAYLNPPL